MVSRVLVLFVPFLLLAQVLIDKIELAGNTAFPKNELTRLLKSEEGSAYRVYFARSDQRILTNFYKYNGFLDAQITFNFRKGRSRLKGKILVFTILENQRSYFGKISFIGNKLFSDDDLLKIFPSKTNRVFKEEYLFEMGNEIRKLYLEKGKMLVKIVVETDKHDNVNIIDVNVNIKENRNFYYRKVIIQALDSGEIKTKPHFITDGIPFKKGDLYKESLESDFKKYLYDTGLFQSVSVERKPVGKDSLDLLVKLIEHKPYYIGLGGGGTTNQNEKFVKENESNDFFKKINYNFDIDFGGRNWLGMGFDTGIKYYTSRYFDVNNDLKRIKDELKLYSRIVNFPFLNYHANINFTKRILYSQLGNLTGLQINYLMQKRLGLRSYFALKFIYDRTIAESEVSIIQLLRFGFRDFDIFSVTTTLRIDNRDNNVNPKSGYYYKVALKYSISDALDSSYEGSQYITVNLEWRRYQPLIWKQYVTFATSFRLAGILYQSGENKIDFIPKIDRFYIGSALRGYNFSRFGLLEQIVLQKLGKDSIRYEPIGGRSLFVANFELRFHLSKILLKNLYIQSFVDIGGLWQNFNDISIESMRVAYGFGFSYDLSVLLVRLDYGIKLRREEKLNVMNPLYPDLVPSETFGRIEFGISYHF